jgi:hypothetical protein
MKILHVEMKFYFQFLLLPLLWREFALLFRAQQDMFHTHIETFDIAKWKKSNLPIESPSFFPSP